MQVVILDYGASNVSSVIKALRVEGADPVVTADPAALATARAVVIPGVGHFERTRNIGDEQRAALRGAVDRGAALLGICLGLQWLFEGSDEAPDIAGLGVFAGRCFDLGDVGRRRASARRDARWPEGHRLRVPHVGWNSVDAAHSSRLLDGLAPGTSMYFTHSFAAPLVTDTTATTTHGGTFSSIVERGRVAGVQFHPEKSGDAGRRLLRNFITMATEARAQC